VQDDLAYPAMLTFLPQGLMGIMVASLAAAYMSTMSTQVNYGSSIVVSDLYLRFVNPKASDSQQVWLGRIVTVVLMFASCWLALQMKDALSNFNLMMQVGAGTGLVLILRWFWWRINAAAEIAAMTFSFGMAIFWHYSSIGHDVPAWKQMVIGVAVTTAGSLLVALLTGPTETQKLREFYSRVQPGGAGWTPILERAEHERIQIQDPRLGRGSDLGIGIVCSILASVGIWALIFAGGWAMGPREVEACATGIFLARHSPVDHGGEGDAVLPMLPTFTEPDELGDIVAHYLAHSDARLEAATAARAAVADRTFEHHAATMLQALDI
jgi:hypothetical protein